MDVTAEPDAYRDAMSRLAAGVAVITTVDATGRPHGLTVSSLASHSVEPPTLLASIHIDSRTFGALAGTRRFVAQLLTAGQRGIAERFATPRSRRRFERTAWHVEDGLPVLDDTLATLACSLAACFPHGDHAVVLGTVLRVELGSGVPLVHADRDYTSLARDR